MEEQKLLEIWLPVIGCALAYQCMFTAGLDKKTIVERAMFLKGMGLALEDVAEMLGTSTASVRELLRVAKNKSKRRGPLKNAARKESR